MSSKTKLVLVIMSSIGFLVCNVSAQPQVWSFTNNYPNFDGNQFTIGGWWNTCGEQPTVGGCDTGDLIGYSPSTVSWTSPTNGFINISGSVWYCPFNDGQLDWRDVDWTLSRNGVFLSSGMVGYGIGYYRNSPFLFSEGNGATNALVNVPVSTGDVILLSLTTDPISYQGYGGFVGVDFDVANIAPSLTIAPAVRITAAVVVGTTYQLQSSLDLQTWINSGLPFTATNSSTTIYADAALNQMFWRLEIVNPAP